MAAKIQPGLILKAVFIFAIFLRLILLFNPGFEADISFWKSWGLATYDRGIVEGMKITNNNYPTPFAYILGGMVVLYSRFADPHNFNEFWNNSNLLFLTISKMVPILADFGIAALILFIGKAANQRNRMLGFPTPTLSFFGLSFYELAASIYLLSPLSLADGAWWGQVDALGLLIFLCSILLILSRRPFWAGLIFMVSMMTKLQNMIYGPLFFLFVWELTGFEGLVTASAGAMTGFLGLNIEFMLTRNMDRVLASLTENFDYFPWMSLNAYNLWWIVTGGHGLQVSDKLLAVGMLNAKTVGLVIFSGFYLFVVMRQIAEYVNVNVATGKKILKDASELRFQKILSPGASSRVLQLFLEGLIIVNAAFFLFQTQSHDRYAFPLSVFLLLWAPFFITGNGVRGMGTRVKQFILFYLLFILFYFYNLHTALVINYPLNGLPILTSFTQPVFTVATAFVLLILFGLYILTILKSSRVTQYIAVGTLGLCVLGLIILNKSLITHTPVSLTTLTPYISEQAYGQRQTNKSVQSSFNGPNGWTRLSVQYVFYKFGIGTHANSRHVYNVGGLFKTFTTDFGIDTEAGTKASAIFEIYGDNKLLFQSPKMGRFDMPGHTSVNIKGVQYLTLITTDAGDGNFDDHTDWLNPQLWP